MNQNGLLTFYCRTPKILFYLTILTNICLLLYNSVACNSEHWRRVMTNFRKVAVGINAAELFQSGHYSARVNCGNCGTYYMQITGVDEPEHLVRCKKCGCNFVWMVKDGCVWTIGMPGEGEKEKIS
jgi:hypothetical protein